MKKIILHLDLDSYFASAHVAVDPDLKNKPIAISTGRKRSIVTAASYEAKALGVHAPMPIYKAKMLCPNLITVEPNFNLYTVLSTKLFEFISNKFTSEIEVASIDECYIDATGIWKKYGSPKKLALAIQKAIMKELKLPVSIGISTNKFVAKMSTQINKPYGITITKPEDFLKVFGDWSVEKYYGIGAATATKLNKIGIKSINDLAKADVETLTNLLGKVAPTLVAQANGKGSDEIETGHNELKGIGNSITFMDNDIAEREELLKVLKNLCQKIAHRAKLRNLVGTVVAVSIKEAVKGKTRATSKQLTLKVPIQAWKEIYEKATIIFDELWQEETLKFVGVQLGKVTNMFETTYQSSIFDQEKPVKKIDKIINDINHQLKNKVLMTGNEVKQKAIKKQNQSRYIESDRIIKHMDD